MAHLRIKNIRRSADEFVYNGSAVWEVRSLEGGIEVALYGSDHQFREGSFALFLSAEEARDIGKKLLQHAAVAEGER